jgi:hypothetical protein
MITYLLAPQITTVNICNRCNLGPKRQQWAGVPRGGAPDGVLQSTLSFRLPFLSSAASCVASVESRGCCCGRANWETHASKVVSQDLPGGEHLASAA